MKTIGIVGSRIRSSIRDEKKVTEAFLKHYEEGDRIVSGGCPTGADDFAECIAKHYQIPITIHYARWNTIGKSAGFIRNTDIAEQSNILIACVASNRKGGTEDTIKKFLKKHSEDDLILV